MRRSQTRSPRVLFCFVGMLGGCTSFDPLGSAHAAQVQTARAVVICQTTMKIALGTISFEDCVSSLTESVRTAAYTWKADLTKARLACEEMMELSGPASIENCAVALQNKIAYAAISIP